MKIITLIENTEGRPGCRTEHGLSFYVEAEKHRLLADTGASGAFLENARLLGVDMKNVDTVVISHGHYDHAGGVLDFVKQNPEARIYLQRQAEEPYYHVRKEGRKYIGMAPEIRELPQCIPLDGDFRIDEELFLFSGIRGRKFWPEGNRELKQLKDGVLVQDTFSQEQCLVITEKDRRILISGCAHNGILNILERFRELFHAWPDAVLSGFHMKQEGAFSPEQEYIIRETAETLKEMGMPCFTGHCTGEHAYRLMKNIMGEQLQAMGSGREIRI